MSKIIILVAPPGAGKSTIVAKLVSENPTKYYVYNRDSIREEMFNLNTPEKIANYYKDKDSFYYHEKKVSEFATSKILENKKTKVIISDNTNLNKKYHLDSSWGEFDEIEYIVIDAPYEVCVQRDFQRTRNVGETIIHKMYEQFNVMKQSLMGMKNVKFYDNSSNGQN